MIVNVPKLQISPCSLKARHAACFFFFNSENYSSSKSIHLWDPQGCKLPHPNRSVNTCVHTCAAQRRGLNVGRIRETGMGGPCLCRDFPLCKVKHEVCLVWLDILHRCQYHLSCKGTGRCPLLSTAQDDCDWFKEIQTRQFFGNVVEPDLLFDHSSIH